MAPSALGCITKRSTAALGWSSVRVPLPIDPFQSLSFSTFKTDDSTSKVNNNLDCDVSTGNGLAMFGSLVVENLTAQALPVHST